jgi:hypothetical protein
MPALFAVRTYLERISDEENQVFVRSVAGLSTAQQLLANHVTLACQSDRPYPSDGY